MALYAVGDLQGCLEPLKKLLAFVKFDPSKDTLWLTGDLVNRGPDSIGCLEFVKSMGSAAVTVLGNHDLHLLATHELKRATKDADIQATLADPRAEVLLEWLAQQPLLVHDQTRKLMMTHAGIPPIWSDSQAIAAAQMVEQTLAKKTSRLDFFTTMYGNTPSHWSDELPESDMLRYIVNALTRMRFCDQASGLDFDVKTAATNAPANMKPWFAWPVERQNKLVFGHWAALMGETDHEGFIALDTGYVWGNYLTLMNLDTNLQYCADTSGNISFK